MKRIVGIVSLTILAIVAINFSSCQQKDDRDYIVKVGDIAPDFTAITTEGDTFKLSDHKGKLVMLQFTASWCGVCRKEMPHIENEIWQPLKDKEFVLVGIDRDEPLDIVLDYTKKVGITYPMALDPGGEIFALYAKKGSGITRNVIVDQNGKIVCLTRLFNEKEFNSMKELIFKLVK